MLQDEGAFASLERPADELDSDVTGGSLDRGPAGQHLALAGAFQISGVLLVDRHATEHLAAWLVVHRQRLERHIERPTGAAHDPDLQSRRQLDAHATDSPEPPQ